MEKFVESFYQECISEGRYVTVETSITRPLTEEERSELNDLLRPHGYRVESSYCETCEEYSKGTHPYHVERVTI